LERERDERRAATVSWVSAQSVASIREKGKLDHEARETFSHAVV